MIKAFIHLFKKGKEKKVSEYKGFSDFFLHAPIQEREKVIKEAAAQANKDQLKIYEEARLKIKPN